MHAITRPASPATSNSSRRQEAKKKTAIGTMTKKFISSPLFKKIWTPSSSVSSAMSVSSATSSKVSQPAEEEEEEEQREERAQEAFCDPTSKCGEIIADRWRLTALLGTGTYGAVYMAQTTNPFRRNEEQMAIKVLWKAGLDAEQLALQRLEVDINAALMAHAARLRLPRNVHPNIVPMRHFHEDAECLYLVMDLHQGTDLYEAIQDLGGLDTDLVKHVFRQIVAAVAHSHAAGVFHRDLKPENVLVTADWQCQLCDYGLSSMEEVTAELGCGSAPYMAPEARTPQNEEEGKQTYRCRQADIWSLGVLLLNLVFACNPWKVASSADPSFAAFLADPTVLQRQFGLSSAFFELLMGIFDLDPLKRPSLSAIAEAVAAMPSFTIQASHGAESMHPDAIVLSSSPTDVPVMHQRPQEATPYPDFVVPREEPVQEVAPVSLLTTSPMSPVASMHYVDAMMHRLQLQSAAHRAHHHHSSTSDTRRPVSGILAF